jgi:N-dimethylarginine dimethylaminohydrolase
MEVAGAHRVRGLNETGRLRHVVMKHSRDAFGDAHRIEAQWRSLNFSGPPELGAAIDEYDRLVGLIHGAGAEVSFLPSDPRGGLDSIYVRDASIVSPSGVILANMGKPLRAAEPTAQGEAFRALGIPVIGAIEPPGTMEGGDLVWLDEQTVAVGEGYRTNAEGIRQLRAILGSAIEVLVAPLPHWHGAGEVLHLMSLISPIRRDLAVVYSPLMPVPFRRTLLERGYTLIEVPDSEFDTMGTNVLALAPGQCVMIAGNARTRAAIERAGTQVLEYIGTEISTKGAGGPTCLTRPIARDADL